MTAVPAAVAPAPPGRDRRRLVIAIGVNATGETLTTTALTVHFFGRSQPFLLIAALLACHSVPQMIWSGPAGRAADRLNPRMVAVRALSVLGVLLLLLAAAPDRRWVVLALILVIASVYTFSDSALFTLIPQVAGDDPLVRRAVQANIGAIRWIGSALGALGAGWATLHHGYRIPIVLDALTYLAAAVLVAGLATGRAGDRDAGRDDEELPVSRLALLRRNPRAAVGLVVLTSAILFLGTTGVLTIGFVGEVLHADATFFGLLTSVYMWGILGGTALARALVKRLPPMPTLLAACGFGGLAILLEAVLGNRAASVGLNGAAGVAHGMDSLAMRTLLTEEADRAVLGRLFSLFYAAASGAELGSFLLGAALGELLPVRWAIGLSGFAAITVVAAGALFVAAQRTPSARPG